MHGVFVLLHLCLLVFATILKGDDRKKSVFKEITDDASLENGLITSVFHRIFHQCSIQASCSFVIKNLEKDEFKKLYSEKDLPKNRKGFKLWQKQVINDVPIEAPSKLENGKMTPKITALSNGKPTSQSTNLSASTVSAMGVDSNNLTCFHTAEHVSGAWWMVDLLHESNVVEVAITTNKVVAVAGYDHMLRDVDIRVGNQKANHTNPFCFEHASHTVPTSTAVIKCKHTVRGRYVSIETNMKAEALTICEVVVYGYHVDFH